MAAALTYSTLTLPERKMAAGAAARGWLKPTGAPRKSERTSWPRDEGGGLANSGREEEHLRTSLSPREAQRTPHFRAAGRRVLPLGVKTCRGGCAARGGPLRCRRSSSVLVSRGESPGERREGCWGRPGSAFIAFVTLLSRFLSA